MLPNFFKEIRDYFSKVFRRFFTCKNNLTDKIPLKVTYTTAQKELFENINSGDLVSAWMPFDADELKKIPEGHRCRPYLVIEKKEDSYLAFYGSSINKKKFK